MLCYVKSNRAIINEYKKYYSNGINIDRLIEKLHRGELGQDNGFNYGRFRVFIDSCLLLLNKEKLSRYYGKNYSFIKFLEMAKNDKTLESYLSYIKHDERLAEHLSYINHKERFFGKDEIYFFL